MDTQGTPTDTFTPGLSECVALHILGDPGADSGDKGKHKRAEKYICNEEK